MERDWNMDEVSDGRLYTGNDMVRIECNDCKGCSSCCHNMEGLIVLDPYDVYCLMKEQECSFEKLMEESIELRVIDGIVLPALKMDHPGGACHFLNEEGRCSIHAYRPGICRLFPLGRIYQNGTFRYFLQINECKNRSKTKIKINKWLGIPSLQKYETFISDWHYYLKALQTKAQKSESEQELKQLSMSVLTEYYLKPYQMDEDFYMQFYQRLQPDE